LLASRRWTFGPGLTSTEGVSELLTRVFERFSENPADVAASFDCPVLLFEPPTELTQKALLGTYQLHAIPKSGYQLPTLGPLAVVLRIRSRKEPPAARITLGRTPEQDLVVDHPSVSRFHAWFEFHRGRRGWQVADNGSRNGTVLNQRRISARNPTSLGEASILGIGDVNLQFFLPEAFEAFLRAQTAAAST